MKGLFIPEITAEMFRNGCLESIETLMAEGEIYDIEYDLKSAQPERKKGRWLPVRGCDGGYWVCSSCKNPTEAFAANVLYKYCPFCGADMRGEDNG